MAIPQKRAVLYKKMRAYGYVISDWNTDKYGMCSIYYLNKNDGTTVVVNDMQLSFVKNIDVDEDFIRFNFDCGWITIPIKHIRSILILDTPYVGIDFTK